MNYDKSQNYLHLLLGPPVRNPMLEQNLQKYHLSAQN